MALRLPYLGLAYIPSSVRALVPELPDPKLAGSPAVCASEWACGPRTCATRGSMHLAWELPLLVRERAVAGQGRMRTGEIRYPACIGLVFKLGCRRHMILWGMQPMLPVLLPCMVPVAGITVKATVHCACHAWLSAAPPLAHSAPCPRPMLHPCLPAGDLLLPHELLPLFRHVWAPGACAWRLVQGAPARLCAGHRHWAPFRLGARVPLCWSCLAPGVASHMVNMHASVQWGGDLL